MISASLCSMGIEVVLLHGIGGLQDRGEAQS
jgi:hypothetical protein